MDGQTDRQTGRNCYVFLWRLSQRKWYKLLQPNVQGGYNTIWVITNLAEAKYSVWYRSRTWPQFTFLHYTLSSSALPIFAHNKRPKSLNMKHHTIAVCQSTNYHYYTVISYRLIFSCIILSQCIGCEEILEDYGYQHKN